MAKNSNISEMFLTKVQALYDIENELVKALPKMAKGATDPELKAAFEEHLEETKGHVERLENIFEILEEKPKKLKTEAIRGLVADGEWLIKNTEKGDALDAALVAAARHVEHYEMAGYMGAQEWAEMIGSNDISSLLEEALAEEEAADEKLSEIGTPIGERLAENAEEEDED